MAKPIILYMAGFVCEKDSSFTAYVPDFLEIKAMGKSMSEA